MIWMLIKAKEMILYNNILITLRLKLDNLKKAIIKMNNKNKKSVKFNNRPVIITIIIILILIIIAIKRLKIIIINQENMKNLV